MKMSGSITVFSTNTPSEFNTITVIFKDDSLDVEKIIDTGGEVFYEDEDNGGGGD